MEKDAHTSLEKEWFHAHEVTYKSKRPYAQVRVQIRYVLLNQIDVNRDTIQIHAWANHAR